MKNSFRAINRNFSAKPVIDFEDQTLTSFSGLALLDVFFDTIDFKTTLQSVFKRQKKQGIYRPWKIFLILIIHVMLGYRRIRDNRFYANDPLIKRLVGIAVFPDTATISRTLSGCDEQAVEGLRDTMQQQVLNTYTGTRITLDFDGSVITTKRRAEMTAVGFNRKQKGKRSYYPLFCTLAQTGQVFDVLHRSGNVHDSNGAVDFFVKQYDAIYRRREFFRAESRMDSAFFSDKMVNTLNGFDVDFTISVPFYRFTKLKQMVEEQRNWEEIDKNTSYFERDWRPDSWDKEFRFIFVRQKKKLQSKEPIQLDIFLPDEFNHDYKVIVTNKMESAASVINYHEGRGSQEGVIGELKSEAMLDYIPFKRWIPNKLFLLAAVYAHNLSRQFQMINSEKLHRNTDKRSQILPFEKLGTIRKTLIIRAGRITRPQNVLTLTISATKDVKQLIKATFKRLRKAA